MRSTPEQSRPSSSLPSVNELLPLLSQALAQEGRFRWRVQGNSMTPTLPPGCEIEIVPLPDDVPLGSLIVFANRESLVVHRLVRKKKGYWIIQGDNRLTPDPPLKPSEALGAVAAVYHRDLLVWPRPFGRFRGWGWVARAHWLRVQRRLCRR